MKALMATTLALGLLSLGCTAHNGFVDYKQMGVYASDNAGNAKFKDVGPVAADESSWVWTSCDTVATDAVRRMLDIAKVRGATTVYKITFESDSGRVTTPTCYKRWGWFFAYVVGGLGPWMTHSAVEGIAASMEGEKVGQSIDIPKGSDTSELAKDFVQGIILRQ